MPVKGATLLLTFTPRAWVDLPGVETPINAASLNRIEAALVALTAAANSTSPAPAHAGTRTGRFDPATSLYNVKSSNTRRLRAALGAARAGTGLARVLFVGDSLTAGMNATRGTNDSVSLLRQEFSRQSYSVGEFVLGYNGGVAEPRWSPQPTQTGASHVFPWPILTTTASVLSGTGTVLELVYSKFTPAFTYSIDGAGAVTVTPNGAGADVQVTTVTGLSNAAHTASLASSGGSAYFYGAGFRQATGVVFQNAGISGSQAGEWITNPTNFGPLVLPFASDVAFVELGVNDWGAGNTQSNFLGNLTGIVNNLKATGANVILVVSNYPSGGDSTWPPYVSTIYDVADTCDVPLVDFADRLGLYSQYNADTTQYDQASDTLHLTPAGYAHKSRAWLGALNA